MPQRLSLKGIDFQGALLICGLMLVVSYIVVYGDYFMWLDTFRIRLLIGVAIVLSVSCSTVCTTIVTLTSNLVFHTT